MKFTQISKNIIVLILVVIIIIGFIAFYLTYSSNDDGNSETIWSETNGSFSGSINDVRWIDNEPVIVSKGFVVKLDEPLSGLEFYQSKYVIEDFISINEDGSLNYVTTDAQIRGFGLVYKDKITHELLTEFEDFGARDATVAPFGNTVAISTKVSGLPKSQKLNVFQLDFSGFKQVYEHEVQSFDGLTYAVSMEGGYFWNQGDDPFGTNEFHDLRDGENLTLELDALYSGYPFILLSESSGLVAIDQDVYKFDLELVYEYQENQEDFEFDLGTSPQRMSMSKNGEYLAFMSGSKVRVVNIKTDEYIYAPDGNDIALNEDGSRLAVYNPYQVIIFNTQTEEIEYETTITDLMLQPQNITLDSYTQ